MDTVWQAFVEIFGRLTTLLWSAGSQFSLSSLACAFAIAVAFLILRCALQGRAISLRGLARVLFPRRIVHHRSARTDAGFFLFNVFVYAGVAGYAAISYQFLTNSVLEGLDAAFGRMEPAMPLVAARAIVTVMLFLAYELGYWIDHWLKHHVPALWELHKVHHTAAVLTPLTAFRMHPLDTWIFANILAITMALTNGIASYALGDTTQQFAVSGNNLLLVVFIHAYVHLQHTHLWIAFRGWAGRVFVSPAHHQLHHSTNPAHFNKNLGSCLALWDWIFGTLHMPAATREKLTFGVETARASVHTLTGELIAPVGHAASALVAALPLRAGRAKPPTAQPITSSLALPE